ncbi:MAG: KOW domain-containing RNA-binding protein [Lachnospiraceae bacterium]|nr:KOW domain-containing RNA-binding protein [Lachnospiraceae bacterium]
MIGQFATSKAGHDKDKLYVVVAEEGDFVMLCDGNLRPLANPKKKRRKHIQPICQTVGQEALEALQNGTARDEQIKYAIRHYAAT